MTVYVSPSALDQTRTNILTMRSSMQVMIQYMLDNDVAKAQAQLAAIDAIYAPLKTAINALTQTPGSDCNTLP